MKRLIFILVILLNVSVVFAAEKEISFGWNQEISIDFAGWKLYMSQSPNVQPNPENLLETIAYNGEVQNQYTSNQVIIVPDKKISTYYFILTAFDTHGNESGPSNEISCAFDFEAPTSPFSLVITVITVE